MSNTQAQTKAQEIKVAAAPFNNRSTDIIIRSSDLVDFYVQKVMVAEASPVFAGMFTLHIPEPASPATALAQESQNHTFDSNVQLYRDGIPIVAVSEPSTVVDSLLRFCYPSGPPELNKAGAICDVLDAARKYMMDPLANYLFKHFVSRTEAEPFEVYALAASRGWKEEMKAAALESLKLQFPIGKYVPEMAVMRVEDYVRLQKYHRYCRSLAETRILRLWSGESNAIFSDIFQIYPNVRFQVSNEVVYDWFFEQCINRKTGGKVVAANDWPDTDTWDAPQWFMDYLADTRSFLRNDPRKVALLHSDLLMRYSERASKCCNPCIAHVQNGALRIVHELIAEEIAKCITLVSCEPGVSSEY